jgi:ABC-type transport system substrate-binding protein
VYHRSPVRRALAWCWLLVLLAGAACSSDGSAEPDDTRPPVTFDAADTMRVGAVGLDHLDPARVLPTDQAEMLAVDLLYDGLVSWDPAAQEAVPALATWESSDDLVTWVFRLRDGAEFHDGSPVTAADVKSSLERLAAQGPASLSGVRLDVIDGYEPYVAGAVPELVGVRVVDDITVEVRTAGPYAPLPELLSSPLYGIVPAGPAGEGTLDESPVGAGPYRLDERDDTDVVLARVDDDGPGPERVALVSHADPAASYAAFAAGDLDWSLVPDVEVGDAVAAHGAEAVRPFDTVLFLGMNLSEPPLSVPEVRRAIVAAIDRGALLVGPLVGADPLDGAVATGVPGARLDACGPACAYSPDAARLALLGAGLNGPVPPIELGYVAEDPTQATLVEAVVEDLAAVGITAVPVPRPFEEYKSWVVGGQQRLFVFGWAGVAITPDVYLGPLFRSGSPDNVTGYLDPFVDLALFEARSMADPVARRARYGEVEAFVMSSVPIVPLATVRTNAVVSERVEGYEPRPDGTFVVERVSLTGG